MMAKLKRVVGHSALMIRISFVRVSVIGYCRTLLQERVVSPQPDLKLGDPGFYRLGFPSLRRMQRQCLLVPLPRFNVSFCLDHLRRLVGDVLGSYLELLIWNVGATQLPSPP